MKVIQKPWGKEEILEENDVYCLKRLTMYQGHKCSLQYHNKKQETIYVLEGILKIHFELYMLELTPGGVITIKPGQIHRMEGGTYCVYLEASTPEIDDVVRLEDDYGRGTV